MDGEYKPCGKGGKTKESDKVLLALGRGKRGGIETEGLEDTFGDEGIAELLPKY